MPKVRETWEAVREYPVETAIVVISVTALMLLTLVNPWIGVGGILGMAWASSLAHIAIREEGKEKEG